MRTGASLRRPVHDHVDEEAAPGEDLAKKHYFVREIYWITHQAALTGRFLATTRLGRERQFTERIMLAVTEANGCELCSFTHTRFALGVGFSDAEVRSLLGGVSEGVPDHQIPVIAFAQHCAGWSSGWPARRAGWAPSSAVRSTRRRRGALVAGAGRGAGGRPRGP